MILNESSRDNLLLPYLEILQNKGINCNLSQLKQALLAKFVNEASMRALSLESNFYLAGVSRYYFEGKLTINKKINILYPEIQDEFNTEICQRLSALIVVLRNAYIDSVGTEFKQPEDFGELSLEKLLRKYNKDINNELGIVAKNKKNEQKPDTLDRNDRVGNGYSFDILYTYEQAQKYNKYTEPGAWCITWGKQHFNSYKNGNRSTNNKKIHYVIFRKDGFENIPRRKGENWTSSKPQDEYGNSLIAVLQNNDSWLPNCITSRWNHGSPTDNSHCEADHAYSLEDFMQITGVSEEDLKRIYEIWKKDGVNNGAVNKDRRDLNKKRLEVLRIFKYAQMRINGGNIENAFGNFNMQQRKVLTNLTSLDNLRKAYDNASPEERMKIEKQYKKSVDSSIKICQLEVNEEVYYFLMDKNKILFETIVAADSQYDRPQNHFSSSDSIREDFTWGEKAARYQNIIMCSVVNGIMLYDFKKHAFVDVGGVKKFKYITSISSGEYYYLKDYNGSNAFYEVKMSEFQGALINYKTNTPLRLPNGEFWYEKIFVNNQYNGYHSGVKNHFVTSKQCSFYLLYDSASEEGYLYDFGINGFVNLPKNKYEQLYGDVFLNKEFPNGMYGITYAKYTTPQKDNWKFVRRLISNGSMVQINGCDSFLNINYIGEGFYFYEDLYKSVHLYNEQENREYAFPVDNEFLSGRLNYELDIDFAAFYLNDSLGKEIGSVHRDNCVIMSKKLKKFVKNPINNSYFFSIYGTNLSRNKIIAYKNDDDTKYLIHYLDGDFSIERQYEPGERTFYY